MARPRVTLDIDDLVRRYLAGESEQRLAGDLGVTRMTIARKLDGAGVKRRTIAEASMLATSHLTPEEKARKASFAHAGKRGRPNSKDALERAAVTRMQRGIHIQPTERLLANWLHQRGLTDVVLQQAVGPYNADLAASPVAVEVMGGHWHGSGRHALRFPDRCSYFLDQGWHLMFVWITGYAQLSEVAADHIVAFVEFARRNPSAPREHRVVWGDGEVVPAGEVKFDEIARVPPRRGTSGA